MYRNSVLFFSCTAVRRQVSYGLALPHRTGRGAQTCKAASPSATGAHYRPLRYEVVLQDGKTTRVCSHFHMRPL